jgi:hypothetical protein
MKILADAGVVGVELSKEKEKQWCCKVINSY